MRNDYEWPQVEFLIYNAMRRVVDQDADLVVLLANERSVTHRVAVYLESGFWGWHVDCEYNRQEGGVIPKTIQIDEKDLNVSPDIIVHRRGPWDAEQENNLLAVEVKPWWADVERDLKKLRGYLVGHHYQFAAFVSYELDGSFNIQQVVE